MEQTTSVASKREELALDYWEASRAFSKGSGAPALPTGELISRMATIAGRGNYLPWPSLERQASARLDVIIHMRRTKKRKGPTNVVPIPQVIKS